MRKDKRDQGADAAAVDDSMATSADTVAPHAAPSIQELEKLFHTIECLRVDNWPPGFDAKRSALKLVDSLLNGLISGELAIIDRKSREAAMECIESSCIPFYEGAEAEFAQARRLLQLIDSGTK